MGMSKQTTFTLTLLTGLSVIVPGCAGYLSARMDAVERAHRELVSLESRIRQERLTAPTVEADRDRSETVAAPGMVPCDITPQSQPRHRREPRVAALAPAPAGLPRDESGVRDPAPAGAAVPPQSGPNRREQPPSADHERRHRHRERQEQADGSVCAAAPRGHLPSRRSADSGTEGGAGDVTEGEEVAGPSQAEAPAN